MPADPNDVEADWAELEDAVGRGDWAAALRLVLEFEQEWKTVQGFIEIFAGPGGETWGRLMNRGMAGLLDAVAARPVDPVAVDGAMSRFRMLMPWGSKPAAMTATTATATATGEIMKAPEHAPTGTVSCGPLRRYPDGSWFHGSKFLGRDDDPQRAVYELEDLVGWVATRLAEALDQACSELRKGRLENEMREALLVLRRY